MKHSNSKFICLIDDDIAYQLMIEQRIENLHLGSRLLTFQDSYDALFYLKVKIKREDHLPDAIFLDVNAPTSNNWQFLEQFASLNQNVPIYVSSNVDNPLDEKTVLKNFPFVKGIIQKPLTEDFLNNLLKN